MKKIMILAMAGVGLALLGGCSAAKKVEAAEPACLAQVSAQQAMETAQTVLEKMHFTIEKYDLSADYIRTRPLSGAQFFQFWRQDNTSAHAAAEANMQSIRRIVEIQMTPYANRVCLDCRVYVQQLSYPEQPIGGFRHLAGGYTDSSTTKQTLRLESEQLEKMEWLDKGQDTDLEQKILERIQKGIVR